MDGVIDGVFDIVFEKEADGVKEEVSEDDGLKVFEKEAEDVNEAELLGDLLAEDEAEFVTLIEEV